MRDSRLLRRVRATPAFPCAFAADFVALSAATKQQRATELLVRSLTMNTTGKLRPGDKARGDA